MHLSERLKSLSSAQKYAAKMGLVVGREDSKSPSARNGDKIRRIVWSLHL